MTAALLRFLDARLAEDEQVARAAMWDEQSGDWTARPPQDRYERYIVADYCDDGVVVVTPENADDDAVGQHIARHDPARILAEVDIKRRLLKIHRRYFDEPGQACLGCAGGIEWEACPVVPLLALPYSDHPDFCEEWKL